MHSHLDYASEIQVYLYDKANGGGLLPKLSYNERLKQLDLLPLVYRREVKDLVTFYKLNCGHHNCSFDSYFQNSARIGD